MQAQQASAKNTTSLDEKSLSRLDELLEEVGNSGDYFKLQDGQQATVNFDINSEVTGMRTRTIPTKEGDKEITRFNFAITHKGKGKFFELSNRWVKRALEAMKDYKTTTLVVKRRGSSISDTEYQFLPESIPS